MKIKLTVDEQELPGVLGALRFLAEEMDKRQGGPCGDILGGTIRCHPENAEMLRRIRQLLIEQRDAQTAIRDLRRDTASERFQHS